MFTSCEIETAVVESLSVTCTLWRETELTFEWTDEDGIECSVEVHLVAPDFIPVFLGHIVRPRSLEAVVDAVDVCLRKGCPVLYVVLPDAINPESEKRSTLKQIQMLAQETRSELQCIDGAGLEAVDLMHWRISKRLISKKSSAKLKLVG